MTLCTSYLSKPRNIFWYSRDGGDRNELGRVVGDVLDLHQDGGSGSVDPAKVGSIRGKDLELVKRFLFVVRIADQLDHSFTIVSSGINLINILFKVLFIQHFIQSFIHTTFYSKFYAYNIFFRSILYNNMSFVVKTLLFLLRIPFIKNKEV